MDIKITFSQGKKCSRCGVVKPVADFPPDKTCKDGLRPECRDCHNKARRRKRMFIRYAKRGTKTPMMASDLFSEVYQNRELRDYIKAIVKQSGRGNKVLEDDMQEAAWVRISFMQSGKSLDAMKAAAYRAVEQERKKFWAGLYFEGITFQELMSAEEWSMWSSGCGE
jgi:hypothetical protein